MMLAIKELRPFSDSCTSEQQSERGGIDCEPNAWWLADNAGVDVEYWCARPNPEKLVVVWPPEDPAKGCRGIGALAEK